VLGPKPDKRRYSWNIGNKRIIVQSSPGPRAKVWIKLAVSSGLSQPDEVKFLDSSVVDGYAASASGMAFKEGRHESSIARSGMYRLPSVLLQTTWQRSLVKSYGGIMLV
jgi:hypothetical protein